MKFALVFVASVLFGTCLAAPWAYELMVALFSQSPWPFSRVFDRVVLAVVVVAIFAWRKRLAFGDLKAYFKVSSPKKAMHLYLLGFTLALGSSAILLPLLIGQGTLVWKPWDLNYLLTRLLKTIPAALIIALIEETIFRLFLFRSLSQRFNLFLAASISSTIYSLVHFIAPDKTFVYPGYSWDLGFIYLWEVLGNAVSANLLPAIGGLFLVGLVLCFSLVRTRSIYVAIGLHSAWVIVIKMTFYATEIAPMVSVNSSLERRYYLLSEPISWCSFILVMIALHYVSARLTKASEAEGTLS